MATPRLTNATGITTELVLDLGKFYSANELRSLQTKLTAASREVRSLTVDRGLLGRIGHQLTREQRQLLKDAATLIESVNHNITHAKEKRKRSEQEAKKRQEARDSRAKQLIASEYPLPSKTHDELLDALKIALTLNRAQVFDRLYAPQQFNLRLRDQLTLKSRLIGWESPRAYFASCVVSIRWDLIQELQNEISYDDGSTVDERLYTMKQKVADTVAKIPLTAEEQETLRLWSEALTPSTKVGGQA